MFGKKMTEPDADQRGGPSDGDMDDQPKGIAKLAHKPKKGRKMPPMKKQPPMMGPMS